VLAKSKRAQISTTQEQHVTNGRFPYPLFAIAAVCMALAGCGTPAAKDFGGSWRPVNRFDDKPTEIPLAVPYTYYAAPMDKTLKTMLARWTSDNGMKLQYKLRSDFTLTRAAADIHTSELRDAAAQLSTIYAAQGVAVTVHGTELVVDEVSSITAPVPSETSRADGAAVPPAQARIRPRSGESTAK
jgi:hypothetical protein